jgi:lipoprotein-releasing system permease protein
MTDRYSDQSLKRKFNLHFHLFVALRYLFSRRKRGSLNITSLSLFGGLSLGLMVMITVLGIMNGFQENHISRRIEIRSYHATLFRKDGEPMSLEEMISLKKKLYDRFKGIETVCGYTDKEVILKYGSFSQSEQQIIKLRGIDPDEVKKDSRFMKYFRIAYGDFDLGEYAILLGEELGYKIYSRLNSTVYLTPDIALASLKSEGVAFRTTGFFNTGSYDIDRYWGYISLYSMAALSAKVDVEGLGIKFRNRNDHRLLKALNDFDPQYELKTAQQLNQGYFAALRLEKIMMLFIFFAIFIIISVNTFGSMKLTLVEKKLDIAILKAAGGSPEDIQIVFILQSFIIGLAGCFSGIFLGFLVIYNVMNLFHLTELFINGLFSGMEFLLEYLIPGISLPDIKIYDTSIYYQTEILVKIDPAEIILISFVILFMTVLAAYLPVSKASQLKPNEIIKN